MRVMVTPPAPDDDETDVEVFLRKRRYRSPSSWLAMEKYLKTIYRSLERIWSPDVCVQCHTRFGGGYHATTKEGYELVFCSLKCGDRYWEDFGKFGRNPMAFTQPTGEQVCLDWFYT